MVEGKVYHWKHGWIPLDHVAVAPKELAQPGFDALPRPLQDKIKAKLESVTGLSEPELAKRVQGNLEKMFTTGNTEDKDWYPEKGAELGRRAANISNKFHVSLTQEQLVGMTAVTSTHKRWKENVTFSTGIANKLAEDEPFDVTRIMVTDYNNWAAKRHSKLSPPADIKPGRYRPSELPTAFVASKTPGMPKAINTDSVINAVRIYRDESTLNDAIGGPKQRNFVNNLMNPSDPDYVTVDTWHYRAAMGDIPVTHSVGPAGLKRSMTMTLNQWADREQAVADGRAALYGYDTSKPRGEKNNLAAILKAADQFAPQLFFQSGPASKADNWTSGDGTYPWFMKQTQLVAAKLGVTPNALQAVAWVNVGGGV